jgi:hypothetical protein
MRFFQRILLALFALMALSSLAHATVKIDIDLSSQTMHVTSGDGESYTWPISSGRAGHLTPRGQFRPQRLYAMVYSAKYNNAPMPHSIFFTGGYAIHGTTAVGSLGHPASHGCIRLAPANAAILYTKVQAEGAAISIYGGAPTGGTVTAMHRVHRSASALGYAPHHRARTLKEWVHDPLGNR